MLMNVINFLTETTTTTSTNIEFGACDDNSTLFAFQIARLVIRILQIAVPFALIIWGSLDFFKAVIAGDDKEMKQKRKPFVQRLLAAVIILVLPILVNAIVKTLGNNKSSTGNSKYSMFIDCWNKADPSNGIKLPESADDEMDS